MSKFIELTALEGHVEMVNTSHILAVVHPMAADLEVCPGAGCATVMTDGRKIPYATKYEAVKTALEAIKP